MHDVCVCVCVCVCVYVCLFVVVCGWSCTFYDGLPWLGEQPLMIMGALDLVVWICIQGDYCRYIFILHRVHDHHRVFVSIHVS